MYKYVLTLLTFVLALSSCQTTQNTEKWTIASEQGNCMGVAPMKCLFVKKEGAKEWEFFYGAINKFEYEPGYEYKIEVSKEKVNVPAADQSSVAYTLVKVISKTAKTSDGLPL